MKERRHLQLVRGESWSSGKHPREGSAYDRDARKREVRAVTVSNRSVSKRELEKGRRLYPPVPDAGRPVVRSDCAGGERPCPYVSCKFHLFLDVTDIGSIKFNFPDLELWELEETCVLDLADRGPTTLETVAYVMNITRERVRQVEVAAMAALEADEEFMRVASAVRP